MGFTDDSQGNQSNRLPHLASEWGFSCCKNAQGHWQIQSQACERQWSLEECREQWLLSVKGVPQILFQTAEAIDFMQRRSKVRP
ncbi:MAG: hypothetical protein AAF921_15300 [Cyanobacteria bacterium P01_D01_bin.44]